MSIDEVIDDMRRAAEVNLLMSDSMAEVQDSIFAVEAGVNYQREAEKYRQIAEWLDELKSLNNAYRQGYDKAIDDCAVVVADVLSCHDCPIDCRGYLTNCCKDAIKVYLREQLEGGKEDAGKP